MGAVGDDTFVPIGLIASEYGEYTACRMSCSGVADDTGGNGSL